MSRIDSCSYGEQRKIDWTVGMNKIIDVWNSSPAIKEMHGVIDTTSDGMLLGDYKPIDTILRSRIDPMKRFHQDFYLNDKETSRLVNEIKAYDKRLQGKRFVNPFMNIVGVPHEVVTRDPNAQRFYQGIDRAVAYERTQMEKLRSKTTLASKALLSAYKDEASSGIMGSSALMAARRLAKYEREFATSTSAVSRAQAKVAVEQLLEHGDGKLLNDYRKLIQTSDADFNKEAKEHHPGIVSAARHSRAYLKEMSGVMINSLEVMKKNYIRSLGYEGASDTAFKTDKRAQPFVETINNSIAEIRADDGSYFPQRVILDMGSLKIQSEKFNLQQPVREEVLTAAGDVGRILVNWGRQRHSKSRLDNLELNYQKDPITVMNAYGYEVIGFNKQQKLRAHYFDLIRALPKNQNLTADYTFGMMKYLDDIYKVATRGYKDRPQWINDLTYTLGATTAIRTMGFGFTGAVRNAASVGFYYSYFGLKKIGEAHRLLNDKELSQEVGKAEQESGFGFNEGKAALELITQGLLPESGVRAQDITFNNESGKIEYRDKSGIQKVLSPALTWGVDKSLIFHRWTENWQRKEMFRTSFALYYDTMMNESGYVESLLKKEGFAKPKEVKTDANAKRLIRMEAKNFALNAVNSWAYEYSPHAKSKFLRGVPGDRDSEGNPIFSAKVAAGAVSSWFNMLMHYPHSLISTQGKMIRGAASAARVGQFNSPEQQYLMRYGAMYASLQIISALSNINLNNIIENDTIEKMKHLRNSVLDKDDDILTRGIVGNLTGPLPDDLRYTGELLGILNADRSDFAEILFGNQNYAKQTGNEREAAMWYKISTLTGLSQSKLLPSLADGRGTDIARHLFKMYPPEEESLPGRARDYIMNTKAGSRFKSKYGKKSAKKVFDPEEGKMVELANLIKGKKFAKGYSNIM